ncbi:hypothetical protein HRG_008428 [Hirsutella rhossiliensis]|uniref:Uncharacterized protein n=1 Tax=Hirsutella rhossiliensis TaxID=111463 RepID=A0A9P8SEX5_9HYPO|nr:uncharacterized protein HRG_08428 [Hirsutella rhossiliensis]KAH0960273.1 hypothetical protein HRG_08428 [Hirsutella rhossiliensis]
MKIALVIFASLAGSALAVPFSSLGSKGSQALNSADIQEPCEDASNKAGDQCRKNGILDWWECFPLLQDAVMGCFVDLDKLPGTDEAIHQQCRTEVVKARACHDVINNRYKDPWEKCRIGQMKVYQDCTNPLKKIWEDFCEAEYKNTGKECSKSEDECKIAEMDAAARCLVDYSKSPETSIAIHQQCRAEAVNTAKVCEFPKRDLNTEICAGKLVEAYQDCAKTASTASGQGSVCTPASMQDMPGIHLGGTGPQE